MTTSEATLYENAESDWLRRWTTGPAELETLPLSQGTKAPDLTLFDDEGRQRRLSEFWTGQPALLMFWRHFGCGCGVDRAARLKAEWSAYMAAGLSPVVVGQGEPARAALYRREHDLPGPILCDSQHHAYDAYGVGQWSVERVLFDAPPEYWGHPQELGANLQIERRASGRPLVDDPWRAAAEFVIGNNGRIRLTHAYQHCEDFPDARVLTTAARLS
jgi:peroxiredoxin